MVFAVSSTLVRRLRLVSGFCPSTRTFAIRFFQTPPRGGSPCVLASPSPPSGWAGDLHPQTAEHAQHTTKPLSRQGHPPRPSVAEKGHPLNPFRSPVYSPPSPH